MSEQQYALVNGTELVTDDTGHPVTTGFLSEKPNGYSANYPDRCRWLPLVSVDTGEFMHGLHYREDPTFRFAGDRVERVYQIKLSRP